MNYSNIPRQAEVNLIDALERWYASMCNGDWEHTYGVYIGNIDNPGWSLKVELIDTPLFNVFFEEIKIQREIENDWVICKVESGIFQGFGGPKNLNELLRIFLDWSTKYPVPTD